MLTPPPAVTNFRHKVSVSVHVVRGWGRVITLLSAFAMSLGTGPLRERLQREQVITGSEKFSKLLVTEKWARWGGGEWGQINTCYVTRVCATAGSILPGYRMSKQYVKSEEPIFDAVPFLPSNVSWSRRAAALSTECRRWWWRW